jgi:transposase
MVIFQNLQSQIVVQRLNDERADQMYGQPFLKRQPKLEKNLRFHQAPLNESDDKYTERCSATTNAMMKSNFKIAPIYCAALSSWSSFKTSNEDTTTGKAFRKVNKESALLDHLVSQRVRLLCKKSHFRLIILPNDSWLFPRNYLKIKLFKNNWTDVFTDCS